MGRVSLGEWLVDGGFRNIYIPLIKSDRLVGRLAPTSPREIVRGACDCNDSVRFSTNSFSVHNGEL